MSLEEKFEAKAIRAISACLENAAKVLWATPDTSAFFAHFAAKAATGVTPFAQLVESSLDYSGLLDVPVAILPSAKFDCRESYFHVLKTVACDSLSSMLPYSLKDEPSRIEWDGIEPYDAFLEITRRSSLERSRHFRVLALDAELSGKKLFAFNALEYAERWFHLFMATRALVRNDIRSAGALFGLFSPTVNISEWKSFVIGKTPCPTPTSLS